MAIYFLIFNSCLIQKLKFFFVFLYIYILISTFLVHYCILTVVVNIVIKITILCFYSSAGFYHCFSSSEKVLTSLLYGFTCFICFNFFSLRLIFTQSIMFTVIKLLGSAETLLLKKEQGHYRFWKLQKNKHQQFQVQEYLKIILQRYIVCLFRFSTLYSVLR